jgi:hypothetical protein
MKQDVFGLCISAGRESGLVAGLSQLFAMVARSAHSIDAGSLAVD